jgi:hypothetical protein
MTKIFISDLNFILIKNSKFFIAIILVLFMFSLEIIGEIWQDNIKFILKLIF